MIPRPRKFFWKRLLYWAGGLVVLVIVGAVLLIKLNVGAAANLTDDVLRPLLGDANVVALERIFFNASDKIDQLKYATAKPTAPTLLNDNVLLFPTNATVRSSNLDLSAVPTALTPTLTGEGTWLNVPLSSFPNKIVIADTFIRPDPTHDYALVTLVQLDMSKLRLWDVAGTNEPGGKLGNHGTGVIPKSTQDQGSLVAAFDGGFQYVDGHYGMIVDKTMYVPLKNDLATIVGHADGRVEIVKYESQSLGNDVVFARQNCPMLVEHGVVESQNETNKKLWGRTITTDMYTWRSGVGVLPNGNLVFAVGNSLMPSTLADALKAAGAVDAMQLDINPYWVRFNVFNNFSNGGYTSTPIMKGIQDGTVSYLHGYRKDFFYVTKK